MAANVHKPLNLVGTALLAEASCHTPPGRLQVLTRLITVQLLDYALCRFVPDKEVRVKTRTGDLLPPEGEPAYRLPDLDHPIVVSSVMRAGLYMGMCVENHLHEVGFRNVKHHFPSMTRTVVDGKACYAIDMSKADDGRVPVGSLLIVCDQMIATGGSLGRLGAKYRERMGGEPFEIIILSFIGVQEGFDTVSAAMPGVPIIIGRQDSYLDDHKYIRGGGAGDMGDALSGVQ